MIVGVFVAPSPSASRPTKLVKSLPALSHEGVAANRRWIAKEDLHEARFGCFPLLLSDGIGCSRLHALGPGSLTRQSSMQSEPDLSGRAALNRERSLKSQELADR